MLRLRESATLVPDCTVESRAETGTPFAVEAILQTATSCPLNGPWLR